MSGVDFQVRRKKIKVRPLLRLSIHNRWWNQTVWFHDSLAYQKQEREPTACLGTGWASTTKWAQMYEWELLRCLTLGMQGREPKMLRLRFNLRCCSLGDFIFSKGLKGMSITTQSAFSLSHFISRKNVIERMVSSNNTQSRCTKITPRWTPGLHFPPPLLL